MLFRIRSVCQQETFRKLVNKRIEKMTENREKLLKAARRAFAEYGYAAASMDSLTADAGLTRGALYHNFGDKRGLLAAVVDQIDSEMAEYAKEAGAKADNAWLGMLAEGAAYMEKALDQEVQRIVLLDGPAVLGDPSQWPSQNRCLQSTKDTIKKLIADGTLKPVDVEAAAMLINGAALNAALWIATSSNPKKVLPKALEAFNTMISGFLRH
jgi:AcrR family transcriptional regulator